MRTWSKDCPSFEESHLIAGKVSLPIPFGDFVRLAQTLTSKGPIRIGICGMVRKKKILGNLSHVKLT